VRFVINTKGHLCTLAVPGSKEITEKLFLVILQNLSFYRIDPVSFSFVKKNRKLWKKLMEKFILRQGFLILTKVDWKVQRCFSLSKKLLHLQEKTDLGLYHTI